MTDNNNLIIAAFMQHEEGYDEHGKWQPLQYDTSWDWLMPVVEKIEKIDAYGYDTSLASFAGTCCFTISKGTAQGDGGEFYRVIVEVEDNDKLTCIYKSVVAFIKWYNENKQA